MRKYVLDVLLGLLICFVVLAGNMLDVRAGPGKAPSGPGSFYLSAEGGWQFLFGPTTNPFDFAGAGGPFIGINPGDPFVPRLADHADGVHFGVNFGIVPEQSPMGLIDRAEIFAFYAQSRDDKFSDPGPTQTAAFGVNFGGIPTGVTVNNPAFVTFDQRFTSTEFGFRLKKDLLSDPDGTANQLTASIEPFAKHEVYQTTTLAIDPAPPPPTADVSRVTHTYTWYYGALAALEGEIPVTGDFSVTGRGHAGIYGAHADAEFKHRVFSSRARKVAISTISSAADLVDREVSRSH